MAERYMKKNDVREMVSIYFPSFIASRATTFRLEAWLNGRQDLISDEADSSGPYEADPDARDFGRPFSPRQAEQNTEYDNLRGLSTNAFADLVTRSVTQNAYVDGIYLPGISGTISTWEDWQRNRWDMKQSWVHRAAVGTGLAYGLVLPGRDALTGERYWQMIPRSGKRLAAFYDVDDDEWATLAIEGVPRYAMNQYGQSTGVQIGWMAKVYDSYVTHFLQTDDITGENPDRWEYIDHQRHGLPVPPVARCINRMDLDGKATGEIEPVLPLLRRIDQDVFDRLIMQRFGAWQVRYITGMARPTKASEEAAMQIKLRIEDLLVAENPQAKIGTLQGGSVDPQIAATDADLRLLSAITQTPPHHLLGLSSNLQAEALAAAESGLQRKSFDFRTNAGEFHEQMARLVAMGRGDLGIARAHNLQVKWMDTESRSMSQAADALGKLATQLNVPLEMLWERIPGWTDTDVKRAQALVEDGSFERLVRQVMENTDPQQTPEPPSGDGN